jgi:membrane-bound lytic murein transglycosylase D
MRGRSARISVGLFLTLSVMGGRALAGAEFDFPRPAAIEPNIKFWVDVFTSYGERDFLIHDRDNVWRVYQVMHVPGDGTPPREEVDAIADYLKTKYISILDKLASGQQPSSLEEQRVANLFKGEPLSAYELAAQNLRVQQGMRERFRDGLLRSRYYRPTMERIFLASDLPPELVTLADIESGFESRAKSTAGAVGVWQFTRGTGKEYMRISRYHDDRLNPFTETEAAARLLRSNYDTLGSWPLAITAYNYGTDGMAEASSEFHGDYAEIWRKFSGSHFGFASKNYYPEFLAALQVHEYEDEYFPDLKYAETPIPGPFRTDFAPPVRRRYASRHLHAMRHYAIHHLRHSHHRHRYVA